MIKADNGILEYDGSNEAIQNDITAILLWAKDFLGEEDFEDILKITLSLKFEDIKMNKKENKGLRIFIDAISKVARQMGNDGKEIN